MVSPPIKEHYTDPRSTGIVAQKART